MDPKAATDPSIAGQAGNGGPALDLDRQLHDVVRTAARLTGASHGAFFERLEPEKPGDEDLWRLAGLTGAPEHEFLRFGLPRPTALFGPTFRGEGIVRSADVLVDERYASMGGMPPGHLPVRSYLAVPAQSEQQGVLGALLFGHPEPGRFGEAEERLAVAFAGQAAAVMQNGRLYLNAQEDLEERRRAEGELRRSEDRFRAAVEAVRGVLWTNSAEGRMRGEQPAWAALTGQGFAEYQDFGWAAALHPEDAQPTVDAWNEAVAARKTFVFEHRVRRSDGIYRVFAVRAVPIIEEDGTTIREWVGVHTDITEQREAEARLEAARESAEIANRAKSQFIANMSHELRTPLSAVIGYSGMVAEEIEDLGHPSLVEDVRKIEANARHLLGLINDVLDLAKIEAGRMTIAIERFDLAAMIQDVVAAAEPLMLKRRNALVLDVAPDLGEMSSDAVKIRQCLLNLLGNAAKFTEDGTITLSVRRFHDGEEAWISLSVTDTGIGMTPAQLARLFQRFVQADESTTRQFGGTGLGLAITKAFCRRLGGDIMVESAPGQGSTFTISLPADASEAGETTRAPESDVAHARGGSILVVDDDSSTRDLLTRFLEREGFSVRCARDGAEGLAMVRQFRPKVVLLDVEMPQINGWTVLQAIRADPQVAGTPVVMVSVLHEKSVGLAMGANDYLTKPINWPEMRRVLDRFRGDAATPILVVDDDPGTRDIVSTILRRDGWRVEVAENGSEALDKVAALTPAVIVLDLMMPVMDGFAFLKALRARPEGRDVHVVVLTAKDVTVAERDHLAGQVENVLQKGSASFDELREELRRLVPEPAAA